MIFFLLLPVIGFGQSYFEQHFGATAGIVVDIGTHQSKIGISLNAFYTDYFFQVNLSSSNYFCPTGLGKRSNYFESRNAVGLLLLAGKKDMLVDFQLDGLNHQTPYRFAMGYNYIWYADNRGTSQFSGGFGLHLRNISIYHENDVFAGTAKDRFRSGHFYVTYRNKEFKLGTGIKLWTGETAEAKRQNGDPNKSPNGYKILEDLPYGKTSHGIAYASFTYQLPYLQNIQLRLGLDSEQIRHIVQNRLIHDLMIMPGLRKLFKYSTPHYPRLDDNGQAVFDKGMKRKDKYFMQFGLNDVWSY